MSRARKMLLWSNVDGATTLAHAMNGDKFKAGTLTICSLLRASAKKRIFEKKDQSSYTKVREEETDRANLFRIT